MNGKQEIIMLAMLFVMPLFAGKEDAMLRLPRGTQMSYDNVQTAVKDGWSQEGVMPLSYVMAREKMRESMRRQGWKLAMDIPMPGRGHSLSVWKRRGHKVIVRLWKIEPSRTGISWGEDHHES